MRKRRIILSTLGALVVLMIAGVVWMRIGPVAPVPTVSPAVHWNAAQAGLTENAADRYEQAFAKLDLPEHEEWRPRGFDPARGDPVSPELRGHLERNAAALDLAEQASKVDDCWFHVPEDMSNDRPARTQNNMRTLIEMSSARVAVAFEERDWQRAADILVAMDRMSGHLATMPGPLPMFYADGGREKCHDLLLKPLTWPSLSVDDRAEYCRRVAAIDASADDVARRYEQLRDVLAWIAVSAMDDMPGIQLIVSRARVVGEAHERMAPVIALAGQSPEQQCDWSNPLWERMAEAHERSVAASWLYLPHYLNRGTGIYAAGNIEIHNRILARRRGHRTVLELFIYRAEHGTFPEKLDALTNLPTEYRTDPFGGRPFVYRPSEAGFTLYSVGYDHDDDGGVHTRVPRANRGPTERFISAPDGDFVYWPIPERVGRSGTAPATQPTSVPAAPAAL